MRAGVLSALRDHSSGKDIFVEMFQVCYEADRGAAPAHQRINSLFHSCVLRRDWEKARDVFAVMLRCHRRVDVRIIATVLMQILSNTGPRERAVDFIRLVMAQYPVSWRRATKDASDFAPALLLAYIHDGRYEDARETLDEYALREPYSGDARYYAWSAMLYTHRMLTTPMSDDLRDEYFDKAQDRSMRAVELGVVGWSEEQIPVALD